MMTLTPRCPSMLDKLKALAAGLNEYYQAPVSYTHLTLPTIYSV